MMKQFELDQFVNYRHNEKMLFIVTGVDTSFDKEYIYTDYKIKRVGERMKMEYSAFANDLTSASIESILGNKTVMAELKKLLKGIK